MTWNLYFGADTSGIFAAPTPAAIPLAVKNAFAQAKANDFSIRVKAIADEIQQARPSLIGLQEAASLSSVSTITGATTYSRDFVQILLAELASRGLSYEVAASHTGADTTLPSGNGPGAIEELVHLTDRNVILRRTDVTITNATAPTFINDVSLNFSGGVFKFNSGYAAVDAIVDGVPLRFVTTHLDPLNTPLQPLQLAEILAATGNAQRLILTGDFNSAADGSTTPTYANALAAGFTDVWAAIGSGPGFTCCENASLDNPAPLLNERIDFIFERGTFIDPLSVDLLGETAFRNAAPFYASDHAGLSAVFAIAIMEPGSLWLLAAALAAFGALRSRVTVLSRMRQSRV
jgi:endonuclease/exonuclease/phosphatase family metal-dependent hydrolase